MPENLEKSNSGSVVTITSINIYGGDPRKRKKLAPTQKPLGN